MKRGIKFSIFGALVYLICLILTLPAATVVHYLPVKLPVQIARVSGTIWQGKAVSVRWQDLELSQVQWQFHPLSLLKGQSKLSFSFGQGLALAGKGTVSLSPWGWQADDVRITAPLPLLMELQPMSLPVDAGGEVDLRLTHASSSEPWCEAIDGQLYWLAGELSTPIGTLSPQTMAAELGCDAGLPQLVVNHKDDELELQANASLTADRWQLKGKLKAGAEMEPTIARSLRYVGDPDSDGYYRFDFGGKLALH
jgi:general secretion pathway protein N